jgi:hypothetical protein
MAAGRPPATEPPGSLEERMAHLALGRLRPVFDLSKQRWLDPVAAMSDFLGVRLVSRISGFSRACKSLADAASKPWSTLPA